MRVGAGFRSAEARHLWLAGARWTQEIASGAAGQNGAETRKRSAGENQLLAGDGARAGGLGTGVPHAGRPSARGAEGGHDGPAGAPVLGHEAAGLFRTSGKSRTEGSRWRL